MPVSTKGKSRFAMILRTGRGRLPHAQPAGLVQRMADRRRWSAYVLSREVIATGSRFEIRKKFRQDQRPLAGRGFIRSGATSASVRKRLTRRGRKWRDVPGKDPPAAGATSVQKFSCEQPLVGHIFARTGCAQGMSDQKVFAANPLKTIIPTRER
jgi:hypothetical protein